MSDFNFNFFQRIRGLGLIDYDPLVLTETDFSGAPYIPSDYEGTFLIELKLKDLATFVRVKKWRFSVSYTATKSGWPDLTGSYTVDTQSSIYELFQASRGDPADPFDFSSSSLPCADEQYVELDKGSGSSRSLPHRRVWITDEDYAIFSSVLFIHPYHGDFNLQYFHKSSQYSSMEDGLKIGPTDPVYFPLKLTFGASDDLGEVSFSAWTNISDSSLDYNRGDLSKKLNAFKLKFFGVDSSSDIHWAGVETTSLDSLEIKMEAIEYWTYGGKFDSTTGEPA